MFTLDTISHQIFAYDLKRSRYEKENYYNITNHNSIISCF
jgi:hypothetical protein